MFRNKIICFLDYNFATLCQSNMITVTEAVKIINNHPGSFHVMSNFRSAAILMKSSQGDAD